MADNDDRDRDKRRKDDDDKKKPPQHATVMPPAPVEYNIANISSPQIQTGSTTAPANTSAQNAAQARADQLALQTFFGSGSSYAPQYELDYGRVSRITSSNPANTAVSGGAANNPT